MEPKLITSVYSRAGALILPFAVALFLALSMRSTIAAYGGNATYRNFPATWQAHACPELDNEHYTPDFLGRYPWTEFCGDCGPYTDTCGCHKCLSVRNALTDNDYSEIVRIVDICDKTLGDDLVFWLDWDAFDNLDTDGQGSALGGEGVAQLKVTYEVVNCRDE